MMSKKMDGSLVSLEKVIESLEKERKNNPNGGDRETDRDNDRIRPRPPITKSIFNAILEVCS